MWVRRLLGERQSQSVVIRLTPEERSKGRMLLSYSTQVYLRLLEGQPLDRRHISAWHNFHIARTFLDLGFEVDVISFADDQFVPDGTYDVMVDVMSNLGRLAGRLGSGCTKFLHPAGAHWTVNNARSYARHLALAQRRGVALTPERLLTPNDSVECADYVTARGGEFGNSTFAYSRAPVLAIPQLTPAAISDFIPRDISSCRGRFVWLGGYGVVHKGLDLLLEAFSGLENCHLTVCGDVSSEPRFEAVYRRELYELPNVRTVGWIDTMSDEFKSICADAIGVIVPSASELGCGSVIAGMMNGLIPIVTPSTDIDVEGIGFRIESESVEGVRSAVRGIAAQTDQALAELSRKAWEAVAQRYGRQRFLSAYRATICTALGIDPSPLWELDDHSLRVPALRRL